jgi:hypothetical protein
VNNGQFLSVFGNASGTEAASSFIVPGGTASKLYVQLGGAPGGTNTVTVTVQQNSNPTALKCTVLSTATTCSDTSDSVAFNDGDTLSIKYTGPNGTAVRLVVRYSSP